MLGAFFCTCNYCTLQETLSACELKCVSNFSSFAIPLHITSETFKTKQNYIGAQKQFPNKTKLYKSLETILKQNQIMQELRNCSQTKPNYTKAQKQFPNKTKIYKSLELFPNKTKLYKSLETVPKQNQIIQDLISHQATCSQYKV